MFCKLEGTTPNHFPSVFWKGVSTGMAGPVLLPLDAGMPFIISEKTKENHIGTKVGN